jgi:hypothetical protein
VIRNWRMALFRGLDCRGANCLGATQQLQGAEHKFDLVGVDKECRGRWRSKCYRRWWRTDGLRGSGRRNRQTLGCLEKVK